MPLLVMYEPAGSGHGPNAARGLATAAIDAGWDVTLITPATADGTPPDLPDGVSVIHQAHGGKPWAPRRGRAANRSARRARELHADCFVNLTFDAAINSVVPAAPPGIPAAYVVHRSHHVVPRSRALRSRARSFVAARNLRRLAAAGAAIVVHTPLAAHELAGSIPRTALHQLHWPVVARRDVVLETAGPSAAAGPGPRDGLLVAGNLKGDGAFVALLDELQLVEHLGSVEFTAVPSETQQQALASAGIDARWPSSWLSASAYRDTFDRAAAVVFATDPGSRPTSFVSSSLIDAVASGAPVVVGPTLRQQLPADYPAVVAYREPERSRATAIAEAIERRDELTAAGAVAGPELARERHSYERYLEDLLEAAVSSRALVSGTGASRDG